MIVVDGSFDLLELKRVLVVTTEVDEILLVLIFAKSDQTAVWQIRPHR